MDKRAGASSLRTAQIGASGVLLIQYRLLKCGIESAPMTTDAGIDLVVYAPKLEKAVTVDDGRVVVLWDSSLGRAIF
jgi:hypothetical protein